MTDIRILYTTWPDAETAEATARVLIQARLIACANIFPAGRSVFRWDGEVRAEAETVMILKTPAALAASVCDRLVASHPYETPCILALAPDSTASAAGFLDWVASETAQDA